MAIRSTQQHEVVGLLAAESNHAEGRTILDCEILGRAKKTATDSVLPDFRFWRNQLRQHHRIRCRRWRLPRHLRSTRSSWHRRHEDRTQNRDKPCHFALKKKT